MTTNETAEEGRQAWHALGTAQALAALEARPEGLTAAEAAARLERHGPNRLPAGKRRSLAVRLAAQFNNVLIYALLASAVLAIVLEHSVDAAVIFAVVVINAVIGFLQEGKAERALEAISGMIAPKASVLRDGRRTTLAAEAIVPGDVVLLEAGDRVAADLRLLRARSLKIEEAALTGESVPVDKGSAAVDAETELAERSSMAFSGTLVAAGQGSGIAVATGAATELGRISAMLSRVVSLETPLVRQMDGFARQLTAAILLVALATLLVAVFLRGYALDEGFMAVVGLAVAAIPEGLPAIMTITLAVGVQRMAARQAIVRRLPAVETLGSVSVICTDKTGTLTRNEMLATSLVTAAGRIAVSGEGYAPSGHFELDGETFDPATRPELMAALEAALLCNDAELREREGGGDKGGWRVDGDPMEGALVALAMKAGLDPVGLRLDLPRRDELPFDARHRYMATLHEASDGETFILIKGAPERVLEMCVLQQGSAGSEALDAAAWHAAAERLAAEGQRVLALARQRAVPGTEALTPELVEGGATLLGFVGFIDPPRSEAAEAVKACHAAGVRVLMITGDHAATAGEIARQLGIAEAPAVMSGRELEALGAGELTEAVRKTDVFARTSPEHKLRLVEALQAGGAFVAMTGDGVNDAPALKRADVGVAMGGKGTEAAKEAAEIVLADDNFASIVAAVREGRTVYDNILKVIAWTLPTNGGEAFTIMAAIAFGRALPITPAQILWVNMITAVALGLALAFEPTEADTMRRLPRPPKAQILTGDLLWRILFVSLLFVVAAFGMFYWARARGLGLEEARTIVVNTLVVMEIFYLFSVRYVHGTALTLRGILGTPAVLLGISTVTVAQFALTYLPPLQAIFATAPVSLRDGLAILGCGLALLMVTEAERALMRRVRRRG